ncbi:MAG: beta-ketoacyl-[acyl-carrier-protein] synthase family protein [Desulfovermiculus sp.]
MSALRVFVAGIGAVSPAGQGGAALHRLLHTNKRFLRPLQAFAAPEALPVGQVDLAAAEGTLPKSHRLARLAATEAVQGCPLQPQAVVLGATTGGMDTTEDLLRAGVTDSNAYRLHGTGTVAEHVAAMLECSGPAITVSTACSSGAVALKVAVQMLRAGHFHCILAGGADALCRLTYHGFKSLQLVDPSGASPFDAGRRGMSVGEGAACLVLVAGKEPPPHTLAELIGCGLSCDASHPTAPDPQGAGAGRAMQLALEDAGLGPEDIDYVNMHGTGTRDGDLSESLAVHSVFSEYAPLASSVKGALGHSLGASGALEAVISVLALSQKMLPGTVGCQDPDPSLGWRPLLTPVQKKAQAILSNSFGFGGNNAAVILGRPGGGTPEAAVAPRAMAVKGAACLTGAGGVAKSLDRLAQGQSCAGMTAETDILSSVDSSTVRRMKRLSRMALSLAGGVQAEAGKESEVGGIFWGTGWGPLSETYDFLSKLEKTGDKFSSPTDFMGSVHNAPAGYMAIHLQCHGPNVTTTAGDVSFEQALYAAGLMSGSHIGHTLIAGADEYHSHLSPLLDPEVRKGQDPADGGGALIVTDAEHFSGPRVFCPCLMRMQGEDTLNAFVQTMQKGGPIGERFGAIWAGLPQHIHSLGHEQLQSVVHQTGFQGPVVPYRRFVGQFATAAAAATVLALQFVQQGYLPGALRGHRDDFFLQGKGILLVGLGEKLSCIEVSPGL